MMPISYLHQILILKSKIWSFLCSIKTHSRDSYTLPARVNIFSELPPPKNIITMKICDKPDHKQIPSTESK